MADTQKTAPEQSEPSKKDRAEALIEGYAHGLEHNAPRSPAELAELKFLAGFGPDPSIPPEPTAEQIKAKELLDEQARNDAEQRERDANPSARR